MYKKFLFLIIIIIFFLSCKKEEDNFLQDMVELDKAYMKTLLYIRDNNNTNRKSFIEHFIIVWDSFKKKYYNSNPEDPQWKADFDSLQDILIRSHYYVATGEDESAGYFILHDIKYVLSDLRRRNNINWFVDNLSAIYKVAFRLNELSKIYGLSGVVLTSEEEDRLLVVYSLLDRAVKKTIGEVDKSNIYLFKLHDSRLSALKSNMNAISDLTHEIGKDIFQKRYSNLERMSNNILDLYFNTLQIIKD